jgi:outer membrane protein TolC
LTVSPETVRQLDETVPNPSGRAPRVGPPEPEDAAPDAEWSLPDAIAFALRNNPRLREAAEAVERARGEQDVAFSSFLPELYLTTRTGETSANLSPGSPGPVGSILINGDETHSYSQAELQIFWTLCDFGRTAGRFGQAAARRRITELQLGRLEQTLAFEVAAAYLAVLQARSSIDVQEKALRTALAFLKDARSRLAGGVADRDDVLRAEVQASEAREALVRARQAEFDALARLNYLLGRNASLPLRLLDVAARPPFDLSLADCLQTAAAQRLEVQAAREAVVAAAHGLESARAEFRPRVYLRVGLGRVDGDNVQTGWQEGAGIHLDQPLYRGGFHRAEERIAEADVLAASARAQTALDAISLEVNLAFRAIAATRERMALADTAVVQARESLRLVRVKYQNGTATPTDVIDAESAATRSEQRVYTSQYDYLTALARLDYAMGAAAGRLFGQAPRCAPAPGG